MDVYYILLHGVITLWTNDAHRPHVTLVDFPRVAHPVTVGITSAHMAWYHELSKIAKSSFA